ncbi:hypothetical protein [Geobacillus sp. TFV-3]|uniref:hypothetical protein n=1 Tax=Geobacillus sp. TFV-3 TaxID=1897059 RepID=UPI00135758A8|nr:hypothetical protein [Geobacillus sp. TFV-3]
MMRRSPSFLVYKGRRLDQEPFRLCVKTVVCLLCLARQVANNAASSAVHGLEAALPRRARPS